MRKLCKYPVRKWKDIPYETQERIRRELAVPLPPHLIRVPSSFKIREKRKPFRWKIFIAWGIFTLLILLLLSLLLE